MTLNESQRTQWNRGLIAPNERNSLERVTSSAISNYKTFGTQFWFESFWYQNFMETRGARFIKQQYNSKLLYIEAKVIEILWIHARIIEHLFCVACAWEMDSVTTN